jgi:hypothetical protein
MRWNIYKLYFLFSFCFFIHAFHSKAQLKFLIDDFEGLADGTTDLKSNGFFTYGNIKAEISSAAHTVDQKQAYAGKRAMKIETSGKEDFGGCGKGLNVNVELDHEADHFNFYINYTGTEITKIIFQFQEDDNNSQHFEKEMDDVWDYVYTPENKKGWQLVSIPLSKFKDSNFAGNNYFDVGYRKGKLLGFLISFPEKDFLHGKHIMYFDFLSFSKGKLPVGENIFTPSVAAGDFCALGAWSCEGNTANFAGIASAFESDFKPNGKKLGVVHFFQSFGFDGGAQNSMYPSVERINTVIKAGYIPMITLEDHFVGPSPGTPQPNLYSIVDGHFDSFFGYWAHQIKQVNGTVMVRILHEFNGDWYPWCTVKNDKDPYLVAKAFRYIINIFRQNNVNNVKFIWCPNSMSVPQESWNYIMDAYPGDDYVDFVALDVYNGAGSGKGVPVWRSFRKEGIENYFVLTQNFPGKPIFICETASRERKNGEAGQSKAEWITDMSAALKTDMSKIRLLAWFNEKETFKVNSSDEAKKVFHESVIKDAYFREGTADLLKLMGK